jgi:hypothetical protein
LLGEGKLDWTQCQLKSSYPGQADWEFMDMDWLVVFGLGSASPSSNLSVFQGQSLLAEGQEGANHESSRFKGWGAEAIGRLFLF